KGREAEMARALRVAAPFAAPNPRLVALAAEVLGWPALHDALRAMAPSDRSAPRPFAVPLAPPAATTEPIWGAWAATRSNGGCSRVSPHSSCCSPRPRRLCRLAPRRIH